MPELELEYIYGQMSWVFGSDCVSAAVTRQGGHLAPVSFDLGKIHVMPYSIAPWAEEQLGEEIPPLLRSLRGDFFCMPFGDNTTPFQDEAYPYHGETANNQWTYESHTSDGECHTLHISMEIQGRNGKVDKYVTLKDKQTVVYSKHVISGMSGPMNFGHHAMLKFLDKPGSSQISTSPFIYGQVLPFPAEDPANKGYSILKPGAVFQSLDSVPMVNGETTDLSVYPARRGYDDLAMIVNDPQSDFAWTVVTFPDQGYAWFSLKNPKVLRDMMFWSSNCGRYYAPWDGRHANVMGLEDITSYFHTGLAASAASNPLSKMGYPTSVELEPNTPLHVNYIMGVAAIPKDFVKVRSIEPADDGRSITITSENGLEVTTNVDVEFLRTRQTIKYAVHD